MKLLAALLALVAIAGFASAQDDAFALDSNDLSPDFATPPDVEPGDAAVLAEEPVAELEKSAGALLGEEEQAPAAPAPEPTQEDAPKASPASAKKTPSLGAVLAIGALGAMALAVRRAR